MSVRRLNQVEQILQPIGAALTGTHFGSMIRVYLPPPPGTQADLIADVLVAKARRSIALLVNVMCDMNRFYIVTTEVDNQNCNNPLFANKD